MLFLRRKRMNERPLKQKQSRPFADHRSLPPTPPSRLHSFPRPNALASKKPTGGPAPRRHLRLGLGPGSAEIKAGPTERPPRARPSRGSPAGGARGPGPARAGLPARPPSDVGGVCAGPRSRPLSPGVIKSEILLLVTPVLRAPADLHMKGPRRAWAFSFSHSQWGAAYK